MELDITGVDHAPPDLQDQCPIRVRLLCRLPGDDRDDYWLAEAAAPVTWAEGARDVTHLILAARWEGTALSSEARHLPVGIAFVTDDRQLQEDRLDFAKCTYVAIGMVSAAGSG